jgi:hypothetical protein
MSHAVTAFRVFFAWTYVVQIFALQMAFIQDQVSWILLQTVHVLRKYHVRFLESMNKSLVVLGCLCRHPILTRSNLKPTHAALISTLHGTRDSCVHLKTPNSIISGREGVVIQPVWASHAQQTTSHVAWECGSWMPFLEISWSLWPTVQATSYFHTHGLMERPPSKISIKRTSQKLQDTKKISECCEQALRIGFEWVWIDTCCIRNVAQLTRPYEIEGCYRQKRWVLKFWSSMIL